MNCSTSCPAWINCINGITDIILKASNNITNIIIKIKKEVLLKETIFKLLYCKIRSNILENIFPKLNTIIYFQIFLIIQKASAFFKPDSDPLFIARASIEFNDRGCGKTPISLLYFFNARIFLFHTSSIST